MTQQKEHYVPEYPLLNVTDLIPREEMHIAPKEELSPLERAELDNLRRGVGYRYCVADTTENRRNMETKTTYFQMVAYKEGWEFDPQMYQVRYVHPQLSLLGELGTQRRIFEFSDDSQYSGISDEKRAGFLVKGDNALRMENETTDGLAKRLLKLIFR